MSCIHAIMACNIHMYISRIKVIISRRIHTAQLWVFTRTYVNSILVYALVHTGSYPWLFFCVCVKLDQNSESFELALYSILRYYIYCLPKIVCKTLLQAFKALYKNKSPRFCTLLKLSNSNNRTINKYQVCCVETFINKCMYKQLRNHLNY